MKTLRKLYNNLFSVLPDVALSVAASHARIYHCTTRDKNMTTKKAMIDFSTSVQHAKNSKYNKVVLYMHNKAFSKKYIFCSQMETNLRYSTHFELVAVLL